MPRLVPPVVRPGTLRETSQPVLKAEGGLALRPWRDEDMPVIIAAYADPDIQQWHAQRIDSAAEALAWIDQWPDLWERESQVCWAVEDTTGAVLGRVGLREISLLDGYAELAYWVLPTARGRGVAVHAGAEATRWALDDVGLHRVQLHHAVQNTASCRVAEKLGYPLDGVIRSAMLHPDGWHDMHLHGVVRAR